MFSHIVYGGDYNPEQWSEDVWLQDARLMREAGVNRVSLGIFAWAKLEPAPGEFEFGWLGRVMDLLHEHGVGVNLATPTAAPPPWLVRQHPEILPVTADGVTLWHGARRHYCPHSAAYHEHATRIARRLAEHVRGHPALQLWHVDNEYGCHFSECFCDASAAAFRLWLQARYGTLDALNEAWGTAFWSQHYGDWQEICPPRRAPTYVNPTQMLDWQRFCSDSWIACFDEQAAILREVTPDVPLTTNLMGFFKPIDYWKLAAHQDVVANDAYPDPSDPEWMIGAAMTCDLIRSLRQGQPWLLMEQAPTHVNWRQRNATKPPGLMRLGSYQALARGSNGVMFFQWRASQSGAEKFHSGMVPHVGTDSRVWREVKELGTELPRLAPLLASRVKADVAILIDWESWWALEEPSKPSNDLKLLPVVVSLYAELYRRNITVDFVQPEGDLSPYRLVFAPHLYLVSDRAAENLIQYIAHGGMLLMTFFSGIVDVNEHIRLGGYPAPFRELLGLWVEEFVPYAETHTNAVETLDGRTFPCSFWSDVIHTTGAEVLARFVRDYYAGSPAITRNRYGKGTAYYMGTALKAQGLQWLLDRVCADADVHGLDAPPGVEIIQRTDDQHRWLFALNHTAEKAEIRLAEPGVNVLNGDKTGASLAIGPMDLAVVQMPLSPLPKS